MVSSNVIYCADNLKILRSFPDQSIDLVYLDPPFFTKDSGFSNSPEEYGLPKYIKLMRSRFKELHRVLKSSGSLYCHCDAWMEAEIQFMADKVFGRENLISKIIWKRSLSRSSSARYISNSYEVILFYGKSREIKFFRQYAKVDQDSNLSEKILYTEPDTGRKYQLIDITRPVKSDIGPTFEFLGVTRTWRFTRERMEEEYRQGRIVQTRPGAVPMMKKYVDEGIPLDDVWTDQQLTVSKGNIKTGYPSEKPVSLLERIIKMSSQEGDIILDPFCGSGTALDAAQALNRKWIGIDISPTACKISSDRLEKKFNLLEGIDFEVKNLLDDYEKIIQLSSQDFENWVVTALKDVINSKNSLALRLKSFSNSQFIHYYSFSSSYEKGNDRLSENRIPVEIKKKDLVGYTEVQNLVTMMNRYNMMKGVLVALSFSESIFEEIEKIQIQDKVEIIPVSLRELLTAKQKIAR